MQIKPNKAVLQKRMCSVCFFLRIRGMKNNFQDGDASVVPAIHVSGEFSAHVLP